MCTLSDSQAILFANVSQPQNVANINPYHNHRSLEDRMQYKSEHHYPEKAQKDF